MEEKVNKTKQKGVTKMRVKSKIDVDSQPLSSNSLKKRLLRPPNSQKYQFSSSDKYNDDEGSRKIVECDNICMICGGIGNNGEIYIRCEFMLFFLYTEATVAICHDFSK